MHQPTRTIAQHHIPHSAPFWPLTAPLTHSEHGKQILLWFCSVGECIVGRHASGVAVGRCV
eukprot:scaffold3607_cov114-Isochrysis_galbana.AAC.26